MGYLQWVLCQIYYKYGSHSEYIKKRIHVREWEQVESTYFELVQKKYSGKVQSTRADYRVFLEGLKQDWGWLQERNVRIEQIGGEGGLGEITLERPVFCLYLWGDLNLLNERNFSVVGARKASEKSLNWLDREFKPVIKKWDLITVSGGAHGIDQKVHSLSLSLERPTICFLPSGFREVYPKKLEAWVKPILRNGGLLASQFPLRETVRPYHFHLRNQLIAAISKALFVVQANSRGGTMMTANYASKIYRDIATLPFFPGMEGNGNLDLISDGATLLKDQIDLEIFLSRKGYPSLSTSI